jgi:hypothetical protein
VLQTKRTCPQTSVTVAAPISAQPVLLSSGVHYVPWGCHARSALVQLRRASRHRPVADHGKKGPHHAAHEPGVSRLCRLRPIGNATPTRFCCRLSGRLGSRRSGGRPCWALQLCRRCAAGDADALYNASLWLNESGPDARRLDGLPRVRRSRHVAWSWKRFVGIVIRWRE